MAIDIRSLWNFEDPAASEAVFREHLVSAEGEWRLELLTQLARALGLQRKFAEAHELLDSLPQLGTPPLARWEAYALLERGRVLNSSGLKAEARPLFEQACLSAQTDLRIDALHMIAIVAEPAEALQINEQAIAEAQASDDPRARRWLGSLLNNTAWSYHSLGNFERALQLFEDAHAFRVEQGDKTTIAIASWCIGRCLRSLDRIEEALALQESLDPENGYVSEELGECLLALGRAEEASPHFANAYEKLSADPWLLENEGSRLDRLRTLGTSPTA